jgi:iron complex outermembrane receptor protein
MTIRIPTIKGAALTTALQVIMLMLSIPLAAQRSVNGQVISVETGQGLAGASVLVKGTSVGTVADINGNYQIQVPAGSEVLVFSYVGMLPQEVRLGDRSSVDVTLREDATTLSDVVISATRQPVRKIETTTAVEVLGPKQLARVKAEGIAEAINSAPGVFTNTSQGRRGFIITRGFPDGSPTGGLVYTGILLDGIPTLGTPGKLPEAGFGFDLNIDRVEVVRGSAATLFGRASAAGAVNVITRTGGEKLGGTVRLTNYNDILGVGGFNYRAAVNLNGPISENLRFNVGGWFLNDSGFRNTGYNDDGGQARANLDYLLPNNKGVIRLYGMYSNFNFQNLTDVPINMETLMLDARWKNTDTYQSENLAGIDFRIVEGSGPTARPVTGPDGQQIVRNLGEAMASPSTTSFAISKSTTA